MVRALPLGGLTYRNSSTTSAASSHHAILSNTKPRGSAKPHSHLPPHPSASLSDRWVSTSILTCTVLRLPGSLTQNNMYIHLDPTHSFQPITYNRHDKTGHDCRRKIAHPQFLASLCPSAQAVRCRDIVPLSPVQHESPIGLKELVRPPLKSRPYNTPRVIVPLVVLHEIGDHEIHVSFMRIFAIQKTFGSFSFRRFHLMVPMRTRYLAPPRILILTVTPVT